MPTNQREAAVQQQVQNKLLQADPWKKDGIIGAFIRSHRPAQVIQEFANGIYRPTAIPYRYDYLPGSGSWPLPFTAGRAIYKDARGFIRTTSPQLARVSFG